MSRVRSLAVLGAASVSALALAASPASAATTALHSGSAGGPAYSGSIPSRSVGTITVGSFLGDTHCSSSSMDGTIGSDGADMNITAAAFDTCAGPLGTMTVTANLPWSSGSFVHAPVADGQDGTITISGFSATATVIGIQCSYSGTVTGSIYNADNPQRPDTSVDQLQSKITNASVPLVNGGWLCPGNVTISIAYQMTGGSGERLWLSN